MEMMGFLPGRNTYYAIDSTVPANFRQKIFPPSSAKDFAIALRTVPRP